LLHDEISFFLVPKLFSDSDDDSAGESGSGVSGGLAQLETEVVDVGMDHNNNAVVALEVDELVGYCDFLDLTNNILYNKCVVAN
jgi:hypothetical protein